MIERDIREFVRLVGSLSLDQAAKQRIEDYLCRNTSARKEKPAKYIAVASAVAFLAVGTYLVTRGSKQDIKIM